MITKTPKFQLPEDRLDLDEEALAKTGTEEAYVELVMGNLRGGFLYGRWYCGSRFEDDELLSIVYKAMLAAARRFQPGKQRLSSWCKPFIRGELQRAWKENLPLGMSMPEFPPPPCGVWSPDDEQDPGVVELDYVNFDYDSVEKADLKERVRPWLSRLSKHEQLVADLIYFGGYTQTDAARLLGTKRQAVKQVLERVHEKLKKYLT